MAIFNFEEDKTTPSFNFEEKPKAFNFEEEPTVTTRPTPQQTNRAVSVTPPIEGQGGAAFGIFPRTLAKQPVAPSLEATQPIKPRDFSAVDAAIERLTPKPKAQAFPVMTEADKLFGPMPKPNQPMGGRNIGLTPEMAAKSPDIVALGREYWDMRYPNLQKPKSDVDLMKAINDKSKVRTYGKVAQLAWLENATPKQRAVEAKISQIQDKMPKDVLDTVALELTDPINYFGAGAGKVARESFIKKICH